MMGLSVWNLSCKADIKSVPSEFMWSFKKAAAVWRISGFITAEPIGYSVCSAILMQYTISVSKNTRLPCFSLNNLDVPLIELISMKWSNCKTCSILTLWQNVDHKTVTSFLSFAMDNTSIPYYLNPLVISLCHYVISLCPYVQTYGLGHCYD